MGTSCQTLTVAEILEMNRLLIQKYGGAGVGFHNRGSLEFALEEIHGFVFGQERFPTIFDKAACLGWRIISGHVFIDGNKRTAMMATLAFLDLNNISCELPISMIVDCGCRIATSNLTIEALSKILKQYSK
jgi:death-on-curing protein